MELADFVMTITDHFRADRQHIRKYAGDFEAKRADLSRHWREMARALLWEIARRSLGVPVLVWRRSKSDSALGVPFAPYWAKLSDKDLADLQEALIRARYDG